MKLPLPRRRAWRVAIYLGSLLLVLIAADMLLVQWRRRIHPGYDTTRIVAPVQADGSIDYAAAIDEHFGAGITPDNNAAVLLLQALGRGAIPKVQPPDGLTQRLGMPHLPESGDYFIPFDEYCKQHSITEPQDWADQTIPKTWPPKLDDSMQQWVKTNDKPLDVLVRASQRPRFFIPINAGYRYTTLAEVLIPHAGRLRNASRALQARALMRLAGADDVRGFQQDMLALHRWARLIAQQVTMIERLVGMAIETAACQAERAAASGGKIPPDQARAMARDLGEMPDVPSLDEALDYGERYFSLDILQALARRSPTDAGRLINALTGMPEWRFGPPMMFELVPIPYEQLMRTVNHSNDGALAAQRQTTYRQRMAAMDLWQRQVTAREVRQMSLWHLTSPDWPLELFAGPWIQSLQREQSARMERRLTQVVLALAAFKAEHGGAYPAALDELAPAYLPVVPRDLFSDKPLIYARRGDGYILYSVGPNMTDDAGNDRKPADDILMSIASGQAPSTQPQ
jgi:hypothetical protein